MYANYQDRFLYVVGNAGKVLKIYYAILCLWFNYGMIKKGNSDLKVLKAELNKIRKVN